ncbi:MAG: hypothetical protein K2P81_14105 [Bacteriovoracaceae bacterium]|nr:hypothetical protein [Bacteriovoracaceae bacterium]
MNRMKLQLGLILTCLIGMVGCSDLGKNSVVNKPIQSDRFNVGCELSIENFKFIMEKDITPQINCLEKNIDLFMKVVESGRPGYLSRTAFELYVKKNVPDFKPENIRAIKSVFDIAHLIFGDDREYLSPGAVKKIFSFVYLFNREMPKVYPFFISKEETPFNLHDIQRIRVYKAADAISRALLDIFKGDRGDQIHKVNIIDIIESFTNDDTAGTLDKVKAILFVKKVILGGVKDELTHLELQDLLYKFAPAGSVVFDLARVKYVDLTQKSLMELVSTDVEVFDRLLYYPADSGERLFNVDDIAEAIPYFLGDSDNFPDLKKYREEMVQIKMLLMSEARWHANEDLSGKDWVLPGELKLLVSHAKDLSKRGAIYHRIYEFFKPYLDSPGTVNINYNNYLLQFPTHEKYVKEFARISNEYRFFWGSFEFPYYSNAFRRNAEGMVEIGLVEYGLYLVTRRYGEEAPGKTWGYGITQDQMLGVIKNVFGRILIDEGIILKGREAKNNENITLLSTLFQPQSNGDAIINVDEGTSFLIQVLSSMKHADWFEQEMGRVCPTDNRGRITDLECHREHYFGLICTRFKNEFPQLLQRLGIKSCTDAGTDPAWNKKLIKDLEVVARTCTVFKDGTDVPIQSDDYMPIMVMLTEIEGSILKYDINKNNILDPSEVRTAYDATFKSAIEALVEEQAAIIAKLPFNLGSAISKKIYYYLIKYKTLPKKVGDYLKLLTIGATSADRDTFAAVLKIISEQGEPSTFDCETLR